MQAVLGTRKWAFCLEKWAFCLAREGRVMHLPSDVRCGISGVSKRAGCIRVYTGGSRHGVLCGRCVKDLDPTGA